MCSLLILLCGCKDTNSLNANEKITDQQKTVSKELDQQITFNHEKGDITFDIKELPDIYNYLKDSGDIQLEIDNMKLDFIQN